MNPRDALAADLADQTIESLRRAAAPRMAVNAGDQLLTAAARKEIARRAALPSGDSRG